MKIAVALLIALACVVAIWYFTRQVTSDTDGGFVTTRDFPALVSALKETGGPGSFWVVLVPGTAKADGYTANLQYSIEDGVVGLDWVLIAERNLEDKQRFLDVAHSAGAKIEEKEGNGVRYLRATGTPDLTGLGREILQRLYAVKPDDNLQLIVTGFKWHKTSSTTPTI
jgi:hypothetical protein